MSTIDLPTTVARGVAEARQRAGLTQCSLAQAAGVHHATISRIEGQRRAPNLALLGRICEALAISPSDLLALGEVA